MTAEELYSTYRPKVYGYIFGKLQDKALAEDLTNDVFVKVTGAFSSYDSKKASYSTWIYTITRNTVISYFRQKRPQFLELVDDCGICAPKEAEVEERYLTAERLKDLAEALQTLDKREQKIIYLHYYKNLSNQEVAEQLGLGYANVKVIQSRAMKKLREIMER